MPPPSITPSVPIAPFTIARMEVHVFRAEVAKPVIASFGTMSSRACVLMSLTDTDGTTGWGELWGNSPTVTSEYRARLAGWALPALSLGKTVPDIPEFMDDVHAALRVMAVQSDEPGPVAGIAAGLDQALWDLAARRTGLPLRALLKDGAPDRVPAYASGLNPTDGPATVIASRERGFRRFKLKIGFGDDTDHANLEAIRRDMSDGEALFTDVNQRWSPDEAVRQVTDLAAFDLGWVEEPIRADQPAEAWRAVRAAAAMPLAGGENLRADAFDAALEWLDVVQPDTGKLGGVTGCLAIGRAALARGRMYCPHWLSGGVGLLHSANLLAAAGGDGKLEMDVNENPLRDAVSGDAVTITDGDAILPMGPGIGIDVDTDALAEWRVSHERFECP